MGALEHQIKAESWSRIIKSKESSGMKTMDFCRQQGLSRYQFDYWRKRLRRSPIKAEPEKLPSIKKQKNLQSFAKAEVLPLTDQKQQQGFSMDPKWVAEFLLHLQGGLR